MLGLRLSFVFREDGTFLTCVDEERFKVGAPRASSLALI